VAQKEGNLPRIEAPRPKRAGLPGGVVSFNRVPLDPVPKHGACAVHAGQPGGRRSGYLYILVGTTLWGVSSVVAKALFNAGLPPSYLVLARLTLSTMMLFIVLLLFDRSRLMIRTRDLPYFFALGFVGMAGVQYTYYFTISKINVGPAVLIQYLAPIWITLYASLFQKEPMTSWKGFSLVLAVTGCFLVMGGYQMDFVALNHLGIVSGVISSLFFAFYSLFGERGLKRYDPWTLLLYAFAFGALFYWITLSPSKLLTAGYPLKVWLAFLFIALFATLIPFGFYFKGMERIRATRASITSTWEPVVASLTAFLVLGETLHPWQVAGGISVIAAVILLQVGKEKAGPFSAFDIRRTGPATPSPGDAQTL
jgi:drug/metabolite transporter (DMT)-like permease